MEKQRKTVIVGMLKEMRELFNGFDKTQRVLDFFIKRNQASPLKLVKGTVK